MNILWITDFVIAENPTANIIQNCPIVKIFNNLLVNKHLILAFEHTSWFRSGPGPMGNDRSCFWKSFRDHVSVSGEPDCWFGVCFFELEMKVSLTFLVQAPVHCVLSHGRWDKVWSLWQGCNPFFLTLNFLIAVIWTNQSAGENFKINPYLKFTGMLVNWISWIYQAFSTINAFANKSFWFYLTF